MAPTANMTGILIRRGTLEFRDTQGDAPMKMEAETEVMCL